MCKNVEMYIIWYADILHAFYKKTFILKLYDFNIIIE